MAELQKKVVDDVDGFRRRLEQFVVELVDNLAVLLLVLRPGINLVALVVGRS